MFLLIIKKNYLMVYSHFMLFKKHWENKFGGGGVDWCFVKNKISFHVFFAFYAISSIVRKTVFYVFFAFYTISNIL